MFTLSETLCVSRVLLAQVTPYSFCFLQARLAAEAAARQAAAKVVEPHLKYAAQLVALVDMGFAGLVVYSISQLIVAARLLDSSVFLRCIRVLTNGHV